jgi:hypothetical protein
LPLTKPRPHPTKASHRPPHRPLAEIRSALRADDDVSQALAEFAGGRICFAELNRVLDAAEEQNTP